MGETWHRATYICQHLDQDGLTIEPTPQYVWRLPNVDEAVWSMARHGENCGGEWDSKSGLASYRTNPDKESPLWDIHSQVIYWWTATEIDDGKAYIVVYDGKVWSRAKNFDLAYLGFRCVTNP